MVQTLASHITKGDAIDKDETNIFKSTEVALFDAVTASMIYEKAVKTGTGMN